MELKTRYQYTYFIHTYVISQSRYQRYILRLLRDKRFSLKIFQKDKDLETYTYFLPKIRSFLFKTFELNKPKIDKLNELPLETKSALLAECPCITFEYNMDEDMQGKTVDENSIFFKIQKIGLVLFSTGICFLYIKTNIEDSKEFADVLNFNYKFRDINQEYSSLKNYENIRVQANCFDDIKELKQFITEITGPNFDALKMNLDVERFYTFSYLCVEQTAWNSNNSFDNIKNDFLRYVNILPNDKGMNVEENDIIKIVSKDKYAKIGISKLGVALFSSDADLSNYTILPQEFENQYFYTYILSLYLMVYLNKLDYAFKKNKNINKVRQRFIEFTKGLWIQEITSEDLGSLLYQDMKDALGIDNLYNEVKNKYDVLYRELKIEKTEKMSKIIVFILVTTLVFNILNFIMYFRQR